MTDEQLKQAQEEMLERAGALEILTKSNGWKHVQAWIENHIQEFATTSITKGFKGMDEFNYARGYVNGLRELLVDVQSHLDNLEQYRRDNRS